MSGDQMKELTIKLLPKELPAGIPSTITFSEGETINMTIDPGQLGSDTEKLDEFKRHLAGLAAVVMGMWDL